MRRSAALLLAGRTASRLGSAFLLAALPLYLLQRTGSLTLSGLFFTLSGLPPLMTVPFLGPLVERVGRKSLLLLCDGGACVLCALLAAVPLPLPLLLVGMTLFQLLSHIFELSSKVLFSELCPPETLQRLNGLKSFLDNSAAVAAPAAGALVFGLWGFRAVLVLCTAAFGLSALQEAMISYVPRLLSGGEPPRLGDGLRWLSGQRELRTLFLLVMALNFFVANSEEIIFPGILTRQYQLPEGLYGLAVSASTAGTLLGSLLLLRAGHFRPTAHLRALFLVNSALMAAIGLAAAPLRASPAAYFALFLAGQTAVGGLTAWINVPLISCFQISVPLERQGRFFALLAFFSGLLIPLGTTWTGFLADALGAGPAYALNNLCVVLLVLLIRLPAL